MDVLSVKALQYPIDLMIKQIRNNPSHSVWLTNDAAINELAV